MLDEEEELQSAIRRKIEDQIGLSYAKKFRDDYIREKKSLDNKIKTLIATGTGLIIQGGVGVGKTMDLVYIFKEILKVEKKGKSTLFHEEDFINKTVRYYYMPVLFSRLHSGEQNVPLAKYVLLDDIGAEYAEKFALSQFGIFMEKIYGKEISLIATTNLSIAEFEGREGWQRITDRMREICSIMIIKGSSMRHK